MKASDKIKNYIKGHVGFKMDAQNTGWGWSIGYDHRAGPGTQLMGPLTKEKANELFNGDVTQVETAIANVAKAGGYNQTKYDALFLLVWVIGLTNFDASEAKTLMVARAKDSKILPAMSNYESTAPGSKVYNAMIRESLRLWARTKQTWLIVSGVLILIVVIVAIVVIRNRRRKKKKAE